MFLPLQKNAPFSFSFDAALLFVEESRARAIPNTFGSRPSDPAITPQRNSLSTSSNASVTLDEKDSFDTLLSLYERLQDPRTGVETKTKGNMFNQKRAFLNYELVRWLMGNGEAEKVQDALNVRHY